ncbi:type II secretion system protein GspL [Roseivivax sediminis]|uniref:GspL domain-containing protein n=1 Tax=Roseivivax sediminis TaxID=936889 RepID=A0A1I2AAG1_9RHOB|nr:type II secretion system protein GspL [Roseivivax sediminis]SFE41034.1 GspL domain-containing protein [Roseivivax sediminis]
MAEDLPFHDIEAGPPPHGRHVALVPGAEAPLLTLDLPAKLTGSAREEVARRQLRDRIGAEGERVELRPYALPRSRTPWRRAVVADRACLSDWRRRAGPGCRAVLPDYLALPAAEGLWTVAVEAEAVRARLGPGDGFSAETPLACGMLTRALADDRPRAILAPGEVPDWLTAFAAAADIPLVTEAAALGALGIGAPGILANGEMALDLRADPQAARAALRGAILPWRWPLLAGALAAAIFAAAEMLRQRALEAEIASVRTATMEVVRESFVPSGPILDVRVQVARALDARTAAASGAAARPDPVALLQRAASVIADTGVVTQEVRYLPSEGLRLAVTLGDFAAADALVAALGEAGLAADLAEARVSDGRSGVRAEIRVEASE